MSRPTQEEIDDERAATSAHALDRIADVLCGQEVSLGESSEALGVLDYLQLINTNLNRVAVALEELVEVKKR